MASVVDICNMALSRIGNGQRIDSLTERSAQAEKCALFYEQTRDTVLRDFNWPFATKFVQLAQVADNPNPSGEYSYAYPTDCLMARKLVNAMFPIDYLPSNYGWHGLPQIPSIPFRIIQGDSTRLIATSVTPARLEYTARIEDSGQFDPLFVSALSWKLAVELCLPLAKEQNIAQSCEQQYQTVIASARAQALNEAAPGRMPESTFITGRY